jgi:hypothetical protein
MDTHKNDPERSRKWFVPLWIAACQTPRLRANSIRCRRPSANGLVASVPKAWLACAIDPQDPFHRQAKFRLPQPTPSKTCAVSAAPRSTSQSRSASPKTSVSRILKRRGLSRLSSLELQEPHPRSGREKPPFQQRGPSCELA